MSKDKKGVWDLKVNKKLVEKWLADGLDEDKKIHVAIADRNFRPREERN